MEGICNISIVPMRAEPTSKSEMTSQLLFGETYSILMEEGDWVKINTHFDNYEAWINRGQSCLTDEKFTDKLITVCSFPFLKLETENGAMIIPAGSTIIGDNGEFNLGNKKFNYKLTDLTQTQGIINTSKQYLTTPYLWGGKTPFGIDCSGFTQSVFKQNNCKLFRDAKQQAQQGESISFLTETIAGDLAFFDNDNGEIIHVGILLDSEHIIHASGTVRIDKIDNFGILNNETKKYSHKLRIIKRII